MPRDFTKCTTIGELKKAIADLPDDMPVGKWDGDYAMIYPWVNGAPGPVYLDTTGSDTIYGGYDGETPSKTMLVI